MMIRPPSSPFPTPASARQSPIRPAPHGRLQCGDCTTWCDAFDKRPAFTPLPATDSLEGVQQAAASIYGFKRGSLLALLTGACAGIVHACPCAYACAWPWDWALCARLQGGGRRATF